MKHSEVVWKTLNKLPALLNVSICIFESCAGRQKKKQSKPQLKCQRWTRFQLIFASVSLFAVAIAFAFCLGILGLSAWLIDSIFRPKSHAKTLATCYTWVQMGWVQCTISVEKLKSHWTNFLSVFWHFKLQIVLTMWESCTAKYPSMFHYVAHKRCCHLGFFMSNLAFIKSQLR